MESFFYFATLEKKIRYTLGKSDRLKSRKVIEQLFKTGKSFTVFPFRVLYIIKPALTLVNIGQPTAIGSRLQTGFTVSSRHFKKAVDRNLIKRLMREAYRLQKYELQSSPELDKNSLSIFLIYVGKEIPEYGVVYEKTGVVLKRLIKLINETR